MRIRWPRQESWIDRLYTVTSNEGTPWLSGLPPKEARRQLEELAAGTATAIWYQGRKRREQLFGELRLQPGLLRFRETQLNPVVFTCRQPTITVGDVCHNRDIRVNGGWKDASRWLHLQCGDTAVELVVSDLQATQIVRAVVTAATSRPETQHQGAPSSGTT